MSSPPQRPSRALVELELELEETLHLPAQALAELKGAWCVMEAQEVPSEEGRVWRLLRSHANSAPLWLKWHPQAAKARREAHVYTQLSSLQISGVARLLARPSPHHLLLSHVEGRPLSEALELIAQHEQRERLSCQLGEAIAHRLLTLHQAPVLDADLMSISEALYKRWQGTLARGASALQSLPVSSQREALLRLWEELERCCAEQGRRLKALDEEGLLGARCLAHRDLNMGNLLVSGLFEPLEEPSARVELRLLDWGQSRLDWWGSDWASLWCRTPACERMGVGSYKRVAWRLFAEAQGWSSSRATQALKLVRLASLCYALDTLTWGERHGAQEVIDRGVRELNTLSCEERSCELA